MYPPYTMTSISSSRSKPRLKLSEQSVSPPRKRKQFAAYDHNKIAVKIKKFKIDTTSNAKDVLVGDGVSIEDCPNINFQNQSCLQ